MAEYVPPPPKVGTTGVTSEQARARVLQQLAHDEYVGKNGQPRPVPKAKAPPVLQRLQVQDIWPGRLCQATRHTVADAPLATHVTAAADGGGYSYWCAACAPAGANTHLQRPAPKEA